MQKLIEYLWGNPDTTISRAKMLKHVQLVELFTESSPIIMDDLSFVKHLDNSNVRNANKLHNITIPKGDFRIIPEENRIIFEYQGVDYYNNIKCFKSNI